VIRIGAAWAEGLEAPFDLAPDADVLVLEPVA
jgi:hypothetical protein